MNPTIQKLIRKETYAPALQRFAQGLARPAAFLKKRGRLLCFAGLHATWVLLLCYLLGNTPYSLGDEESFVQYLYIAKEQLSPTDKQLPPDVLAINIAYDKQLVDCTDEYGFPQGQTAITDRTKLLRFLQLAEQNGRYRYILLDVFFGADYATPADSALFATIARMKRIVIPRHRGEALADSLLLSKAAYSDYSTSINEGNFVRYEYLPGGQSSIAWRMYEECTSPAWSGDGFFATCNGKLCNRCLFLSFPVPFDGEAYDPEGNKNYYNLGCDLLDIADTEDLDALLDGKYIIIGNFVDDDLHDTYMGSMPGAFINLNAFLILMQGGHYVPWFSMLVLWTVYFAISLFLLKQRSLFDYLPCLRNVRSRVWQFVLSWFGLSTLLCGVCALFYFIGNEVHDVLAISTYFSLFNAGVQFFRMPKRKETVPSPDENLKNNPI